jgi:hypothetical protein
LQPVQGEIGLSKASGGEQGVVGAFFKTQGDVVLTDDDVGGGVDEVKEDVLESGGGVTIADPFPKEPIVAVGHHGELQIATNLPGSRLPIFKHSEAQNEADSG